jgi:hypothetical protein
MEGGEIFSGDAFDHQSAATTFTAKTGCRHAPVRERESRSNIEPQRRVGTDRLW